MTRDPLVSVVLVNFNGKSFLKNCLDSIFKNSYKNYELVVVDNRSNDGSIEEIEDLYKNKNNLKIIRNVVNNGPVGGLNLGVENSRGKYIAILGYDTEVDKNWLSEYINFMEKNKDAGIVQGKLLRWDERDRFFYAGDFLGPFGFLIERARSEKDKGQFDNSCEIFSINSASMMIRKELFEKLGGFDQDYFMYLEETDLCMRTHLYGKKVFYLPYSIVYHHDSTKVKDKKDFKEAVRNYYGCRNYILTIFKNLEFKNLVRILPLHVGSWVLIAFSLFFKGKFNRSIAIFRALMWQILNVAKIINKRRYIQSNIRKVKDDEFKELFRNKKISYYYGKAWAFVNSKPF